MLKLNSILIALFFVIVSCSIEGQNETNSFYSPYVDTGGLYLIQDENGFGYINEKGATIINPQFEAAGQFSEGLAVVGIGKRYGFIDTKGNWVVNPQYDECSDFIEGFAIVKKGRNFNIINKKGEIVNPEPLIDLKPDFYGLYSFEDWEWYSSPSSSNEFPRNSGETVFKDGKLGVKILNNWGIIDQKGNYIIEPKYEGIGLFSEGLCAFKKDGKYGYVDNKDKIIIEPQFDYAGDFHNGVGIVKFGEKSALIDKKGELILNPSNYDVITESPVKGIYNVSDNSKQEHKLYDIKTKSFMPYDKALVTKEDVFTYYSGNKYGLMDKKDNVITLPIYQNIEINDNGLFKTQKDDQYGFIDNKGNVVIDFQFDYVGNYNFDFTIAAVGD